ncbi:MAG: hypothetical protein QNJ47_21875 [Nostocaceae cyanobacterium]|nr:hypothetical protein [Nostocaceae cyanobacterium]
MGLKTVTIKLDKSGKNLPLYGMSSDTAAGLVLARRAMGQSTQVPQIVGLNL